MFSVELFRCGGKLLFVEIKVIRIINMVIFFFVICLEKGFLFGKLWYLVVCFLSLKNFYKFTVFKF